MFKSKEAPSVKKTDIIAAAKTQLGRPIPEKVYNVVLQELAYSKRGTWIFRSGNGRDG